MKENFKNNEVCQIFFWETTVRNPGKKGNMALIHPMGYKPQILTDDVLQFVFDKYVIP